VSILDYSSILDSIANNGFPVVACLVMGYFFKYVYDNNRADMNKMHESYSTELDKVKEVLNNNTLVIQQLIDFLKFKEKGDDKE
jgi:hypothetical protein